MPAIVVTFAFCIALLLLILRCMNLMRGREAARIGMGCAAIHDHMMRGLQVSRIELDEAWSMSARSSASSARATPPIFASAL